jgi:hypothetical protein
MRKPGALGPAEITKPGRVTGLDLHEQTYTNRPTSSYIDTTTRSPDTKCQYKEEGEWGQAFRYNHIKQIFS